MKEHTIKIIAAVVVGVLILAGITTGIILAVGHTGTTIWGCTDKGADNYDPDATDDDGSCTSTTAITCEDTSACNYGMAGKCVWGQYAFTSGCTDSTADNYDVCAGVDDGSCFTEVKGCTDKSALNYDEAANTDDDSCVYDDTPDTAWQCKTEPKSASDVVYGVYSSSYSGACANLTEAIVPSAGWVAHGASDGESDCRIWLTEASACSADTDEAWTSNTSDPPIVEVDLACTWGTPVIED